MNHSQPRRRVQTDTISGRLVTVLDPNSAASEAYRTLCISLLYARLELPPRVIVVTSPGSAEGKSTVCANLGVVLAQADKNVLLVDCDFRRPTMHEIFGLRNNQGLADVLREPSPQAVYQNPLAGLNLKVLTAGPLSPSPAEILASRRLSEFLARARKEFDYVLLDSPPVGRLSGSLILATLGDGVLLTLDAQTTRKEDLQRTVRSLTVIGANILGTVMNNVKGERNSVYRGYS